MSEQAPPFERADVEAWLAHLFAPPSASDDWPAIRKHQAEFVELYGPSFDATMTQINRAWCGASPDGSCMGFRFWREIDGTFADLTLPLYVACALMKNISAASMIAAERFTTAKETAGNA